jgi:hypothetical protein
MRYAKYIEPTLNILIFGLFFVYLNKVETPSIESIIIMLSADLLNRVIIKYYSTRLISKGKAVLIKAKKSFWMKLSDVFSIITVIIMLGFAFIVLKPSIVNSLGIIFPAYIVLSYLIFSNKRGDFYIDSFGFIPSELLKKNYSWDDIENFRINNDSIQFKINENDYDVQITKKVKYQLENLKKTVPNTRL